MEIVIQGFFIAVKIGGVVVGLYFAVRLLKAIVE